MYQVYFDLFDLKMSFSSQAEQCFSKKLQNFLIILDCSRISIKLKDMSKPALSYPGLWASIRLWCYAHHPPCTHIIILHSTTTHYSYYTLQTTLITHLLPGKYALLILHRTYCNISTLPFINLCQKTTKNAKPLLGQHYHWDKIILSGATTF